jgi:hypothetical protein
MAVALKRPSPCTRCGWFEEEEEGGTALRVDTPLNVYRKMLESAISLLVAVRLEANFVKPVFMGISYDGTNPEQFL